jgi:hypothetical protein
MIHRDKEQPEVQHDNTAVGVSTQIANHSIVISSCHAVAAMEASALNIFFLR